MANEELALHRIVEQLEAAWNASDSAAWAALFAEDADFVHILGMHFTGRAAIEQGHRVIFDTIYKGSHIQFTVQKVRFVGPDVAIVFVLSSLVFYENGAERRAQARPTLVVERRDGVWVIVAFQNTLVAQAMSASDRDSLVERHPYKEGSQTSGR
jgi:uncharacterized protein (TIGR02246 family)